jgi:small-conductance mechanosensitive channel
MPVLLQDWEKISLILGMFLIAITAALLLNFILFRVLKKISGHIEDLPNDSFYRRCGWPTRWLMLLFAIRLVIPLTKAPKYIEDPVMHLFTLALIGLAAVLIIKLTYVFDDYILNRFRVDAKDNLAARKIQTQIDVLRRIVSVVVILIALAAMLMTFDKVRNLGTALLASAGVVGIVVGMAAQKTLGTFIAGLQIAIAQPIRIDDVVIVENEWGKIEEVTLTYVVVRIWDLRRLIVPITYFIEKPFQNWTRVSADLLGTVFIYVDYTVPIDAVRNELGRILEKSPKWDKKVNVLQVTNTTERTVELRALMSAADASILWGLRCEVREQLITFIQKNYPAALPKLRAEFEKSASMTDRQ